MGEHEVVGVLLGAGSSRRLGRPKQALPLGEMPGVDATVIDSADGSITQSGVMFWLRRKKFVGSYVRLSAFSRSYFSAPYACRTRSSPSSIRKFT